MVALEGLGLSEAKLYNLPDDHSWSVSFQQYGAVTNRVRRRATIREPPISLHQRRKSLCFSRGSFRQPLSVINHIDSHLLAHRL